jgi:hypothetical protein
MREYAGKMEEFYKNYMIRRHKNQAYRAQMRSLWEGDSGSGLQARTSIRCIMKVTAERLRLVAFLGWKKFLVY